MIEAFSHDGEAEPIGIKSEQAGHPDIIDNFPIISPEPFVAPASRRIGSVLKGVLPKSTGPVECSDGQGSMNELFFSTELDDVAQAMATCRRCLIIDSCLEGALERREPAGIWGGRLFRNGQIVESKPIGRPPNKSD